MKWRFPGFAPSAYSPRSRFARSGCGVTGMAVVCPMNWGAPIPSGVVWVVHVVGRPGPWWRWGWVVGLPADSSTTLCESRRVLDFSQDLKHKNIVQICHCYQSTPLCKRWLGPLTQCGCRRVRRRGTGRRRFLHARQAAVLAAARWLPGGCSLAVCVVVHVS